MLITSKIFLPTVFCMKRFALCFKQIKPVFLVEICNEYNRVKTENILAKFQINKQKSLIHKLKQIYMYIFC